MSEDRSYFSPIGGLPPQSDIMTDRAVFTEAYAVIPKGVMRDIVTSALPHWKATRAWVLARPMSGFAETFSQYILEVSPGGGSDAPEEDPTAEAVLFVTAGQVEVTLNGETHRMEPGGYAYLPPGSDWTLANTGAEVAVFHWIRKRYQMVKGIGVPEAFFTSDHAVTPIAMPDTNGAWATTRFVDPEDLRHDMHVNIVTFEPGGSIFMNKIDAR